MKRLQLESFRPNFSLLPPPCPLYLVGTVETYHLQTGTPVQWHSLSSDVSDGGNVALNRAKMSACRYDSLVLILQPLISHQCMHNMPVNINQGLAITSFSFVFSFRK